VHLVGFIIKKVGHGIYPETVFIDKPSVYRL